MQLDSFEVRGLFNRFDHSIRFPKVDERDPRRSLLILHGPNGVGKTTILRMLEAALGSRDEGRFDVFRKAPFVSCSLKLSGTEEFRVDRNQDGEMTVRFGDAQAELAASASSLRQIYSLDLSKYGIPYEGPGDKEALSVHRAFREAAKDVSFEFIRTARLEQRSESAPVTLYPAIATTEDKVPTLSDRMRQFIASAQLSYSRFFSLREPDLFRTVISRLTDKDAPQQSPKVRELLARIDTIQRSDRLTSSYGLEKDRWNPQELRKTIDGLPRSGTRRKTALVVVDQYLQMLESRMRTRLLVWARLNTFEEVMSGFYQGKRVLVSAENGLRIETEAGVPLSEDQLSSGERHLLYLMVSATVTRRIGTVIAIDEPEMSIHIAWQRRLIPALLRCAANAAPQFIFATHSPQIAASYPEAVRELG